MMRKSLWDQTFTRCADDIGGMMPRMSIFLRRCVLVPDPRGGGDFRPVNGSESRRRPSHTIRKVCKTHRPEETVARACAAPAVLHVGQVRLTCPDRGVTEVKNETAPRAPV